MADNIKRLLSAKGLNPRQLAIALDFKYTTVNDWVNAKTYPRIDKIEMLANFFNVSKSDLVENKNAETPTTSPIQSIYDQLTPPRQEKALTYPKKQLLGAEKRKHSIRKHYQSGRLQRKQDAPCYRSCNRRKRDNPRR
ncbi:helix-turn-helix family protein [Streptococcus pneumoniae GA14373]|nr:helix-turn-helix family protein [Streptococcus pneumoniae GA14373]